MSGSIGVMRFNDGSYAVMFYPVSRQTGTVPDYKISNLNGLKGFLSDINVALTEEQMATLTSIKSLAIHNVNAADEILKSHGLI